MNLPTRLVTTDQAKVCNVSDKALALIPKKQRDQAAKLGQIALEQCEALQRFYHLHQQQTGTDPLQVLQGTAVGRTAQKGSIVPKIEEKKPGMYYHYL